LRPEAAALALLPGDLAQRFQVLPLSVEPTLGRLTLAMRDPDDVVALDHCAAQLPANTTIDARAVDAAARADYRADETVCRCDDQQSHAG
jgi:hypothetical protein